MNSLVGYGVSSDSDSDGDEDVNTGGGGPAENRGGGDEDAPRKPPRNFLLESGSTSSESESDSEPREEDPEPYPSPHPAQAPSAARQPTLPSPSLGAKLPPPPLSASSDSSVFANPFKAQAEQKLSALQKHVPLTMQAKPSQIGGKRMCVSYRRDGRCRFGIKCKFAHDSDLQTAAIPTDCGPSVSQEAQAPTQVESHSSQQHREAAEEGAEGQQGKKKRRVGLSNTLIPPKRAMKQFAMLRDRERLNMS